ncbi:DUF983 domain-containing protein [Pseudohoeflea coraliihabitans]|uniref:DUF983 domain-containing protein n=1 Tax=Pseudohoeflea coraliihabitans TaxID=2860393 RepID=A0ABS6WSH8_9HYPH|nr:DUF983 domain-containing protein [Pseudohoeflea sp. DP4N28-3]MBW3098912.1 DUF983 domain-containing protein [Pseudohoeflea sp. DP4N28-3]
MQHFGAEAKDSSADETASGTGRAVKRGLLCRCPACGEGRLFRAYLKPVDTCSVCKEDMHHQRADDFPAYLSIFIVGHIVVAAYMAVEQAVSLAMWQHMAIWIPLTGVLSLALLQPLKGGVIGLQWALKMHGFGGVDEDAAAAAALSERGDQPGR